MTVSKKLGLLLLGAIMAIGLDLGAPSPTGWNVVSTAHAEVGRPLTPVSVAGVARRTARRCAAGVYDC
jgi:hypothetical protein